MHAARLHAVSPLHNAGRFMAVAAALLSASQIAYAADPALTVWRINTTSQHASTTCGADCCALDAATTILLADVQRVRSTPTDVYVEATGVPSYPVGPFGNDPGAPSDRHWLFRIPRCPTPAPVAARTENPLGLAGVWVNGVAVYNAKDGHHYQCGCAGPPCPGDCDGCDGEGDWNQDAVRNESTDFDEAFGHPAPVPGEPCIPAAPGCAPPVPGCPPPAPGNPPGIYHHHQRSPSLATQLGDDGTHHSPIYGFAFDGYPIYGPYAYANPNGTGAIRHMRSSYELRDGMTTRDILPDGTESDCDGPDVSDDYPLGTYYEDYQYSPGLGDLDECNGRLCITPEYPSGTYAYFLTIDDDGNNAFPYAIGPSFYGVVDTANFDQSVVYPTCECSLWSYRQKITAGSHYGEAGAQFGADVDIDGTALLIGAPYQHLDDLGSVQPGVMFDFRYDASRSTDPWQVQRYLYRPSIDGDYHMGQRVALELNAPLEEALTGDPSFDGRGAAVLFGRGSAGGWGIVTDLPLAAASADDYGSDVSIEDDVAVVGASGADTVKVFRRTGASTWGPEDTFSGVPGGRYGYAVAISGDRVVVGAPTSTADGTGRVSVWEYDGSWSFAAPVAPQIDASGVYDNFGWSVDICGDWLVAGAPSFSTPGAAPAAYVFHYTDGAWTQVARLAPCDESRQSFGASVAISDDAILVGAPSYEVGDALAGAVYVYEKCSGIWTERAVLHDPNDDPDNRFGECVALYGDWAVVGDPYDDERATNSGAAHLYKRSIFWADATDVADFGSLSQITDLYDPFPPALAAGLVQRPDGRTVAALWTELGGAWSLTDLSGGQPLSGRANRIAGPPGAEVVAGAQQDPGGVAHATLWRHQGAAWQPTPLPEPPSTIAAEATSLLVRADQTVVASGFATDAGGMPHAAVWINGVVAALPPLVPGGLSRATGVAERADGSLLLVGWATNAGGVRRPVRWEQSGDQFQITPLPPLTGSVRGAANDVETIADGRIVAVGEAGIDPTQTNAAYWLFDSGVWTAHDLGAPADHSLASALRVTTAQESWRAVGYANDPTGVSIAVIWRIGCENLLDSLGDLPIRPSSWIIRQATAIAPSLRVGGWGVLSSDPGGAPQALVISPQFGAPQTRGDMNCDGLVDNGDIDAFVLALIDPAAYRTAHSACSIDNGDTNSDGVVDNGDIDGFVNCLLLGGCP